MRGTPAPATMPSVKVREALESLRKGIQDVILSGKMQEVLEMQARFHNYSFGNVLLIYSQRPNATRVAGFQTWKKLGRWVKKGEKGIKILAPIFVKKMDEETGEEKSVLAGFKVVTVFDVSQTDGKPLPSLAEELQGSTRAGEELYSRLLDIAPVPVKFLPLPDEGAKGYYNFKEIVVSSRLRGDARTKTLLHEIVHAFVEREPLKDEEDRARAEVVAESATYVVAQHFGLDTGSYSFGYVAAWGGQDPNVVLKMGEAIQKAAAVVIEALEKAGMKETAA